MPQPLSQRFCLMQFLKTILIGLVLELIQTRAPCFWYKLWSLIQKSFFILFSHVHRLTSEPPLITYCIFSLSTTFIISRGPATNSITSELLSLKPFPCLTHLLDPQCHLYTKLRNQFVIFLTQKYKVWKTLSDMIRSRFEHFYQT